MHNIPSPPSPIRKIAVLGNFLPRQCGIATFTHDLVQGFAKQEKRVSVDVIAMNDGHAYEYGPTVVHHIEANDLDAYLRAADFINEGGYDALSVQHEYGIFGGEAGSHLLHLLREVKMPIFTTLHTVLREPNEAQRLVTSELIQLSERVVVMSEKAIDFLSSLYGISRSNVELIPHGIPDFSKTDGSALRKSLGIEGPMILTFGLLSPDKGIQHAIQALPKILESRPGSVYVVLGATHPNIRENVGETYREGLVALAEELGVSAQVRFVDSFVSQEDLIEYLVAADIYITPYLNPHQITSGTLAYALGAGKAVISTPYWYAEELLGEGRGLLVPFRDSGAIADAVIKLGAEEEAFRAMGIKAAKFCSQMRWETVAARYMEAMVEAIEENSSRLRVLVNRNVKQLAAHKRASHSTDHLIALTDDTGIFQHALFTVPNRLHGYCVDDNCRALLLTTYLEAEKPLSQSLSALQCHYLSFVQDSFNPDNGRFRNFMSYSRTWLEPLGSEDSHGRTLWSLASVVRRSESVARRQLAKQLFDDAAPAVNSMRSPRTWAYSAIAADDYLAAIPDSKEALALLQETSDRLLREYNFSKGDDWLWFEEVVSYANARLCQALILAGRRLCDSEKLRCGLESLAWLMDHQVGGNGCFRPIGSNRVWKRGEDAPKFDQQPVETWASLSACLTAAKVTGKANWNSMAENAFDWFLGRNDLELPLFDAISQGCRDGIHPDRINENQGAESTLSFLCSLAEMEQAVRSSALQNASVRLL